MVVRLIVMIGIAAVVVAQIAVVLQKMQGNLRHSHPFMHIHGAEAIKCKGDNEYQAAHGEGQM